MFGYGIVTWVIPYIFRTPPGFNLLVRGPTNLSCFGASPLDGIVETDWLPFPFTMNWQITKRFSVIRFRRGEPICMIMPIRRSDLENMQPEVRNLESDPELHRSFNLWHESRLNKVREVDAKTADGVPTRAQGHYIRGEGHLGERPVHGHQTKLDVPSFIIKDPPITIKRVPATTSNRRGLLRRLFRR